MPIRPATALLFAVSLATAAGAATIPLAAGDYGAVGVACADQPNATIMSFDGRSFSYAHASKCLDRIVARSAGVLTIAETCRAAGDGSPARPDTDTDTFKIHRQSAVRFSVTKGGTTTAYRRCGAVGYFKTH